MLDFLGSGSGGLALGVALGLGGRGVYLADGYGSLKRVLLLLNISSSSCLFGRVGIGLRGGTGGGLTFGNSLKTSSII